MAQNIRSVFGVITQVGDTVEIPVSDAGSVTVAIASTPTPNVTLVFEIQNPAGEWSNCATWLPADTAPALLTSTTFTGAATRVANVPNATTFRVRCTAFTSPTAVTITAGNDVISVPPMLGAYQRVNTYDAQNLSSIATQVTYVSTVGTQDTLIATGTKSLHSYVITNNGASGAYVKFYAKASAPTSADVPMWIEYLPAGGTKTVNFGGGFGLRVLNGLGFRMTMNSANNDNTAVAAGQLTLSVGYN